MCFIFYISYISRCYFNNFPIKHEVTCMLVFHNQNGNTQLDD